MSAEKGKAAADSPAPTTSTAAAPTENSKAVNARRRESEGSLTINQQLATHLATQATTLASHVTVASGKPAAKRKRGSLDQHSAAAFRVKQPVELKKIGFIGSGNIARAIAEGWITSGGCGYTTRWVWL